MASVIVRNLDDDVKARLQTRARRNGHSLEAELRLVLKEAVVEEVAAGGIGTRLAKFFADNGLTGTDLETLPRQTLKPIDFSK